MNRRRRQPRSGMALLLVVAVLATAAILGYALLNVNSLQAQLSSNLSESAAAEYAAESGLKVGGFYLQTPSAAPASWTSASGYKLYASAIPLNDGSAASFDLSAIQAGLNVYSLSSTGRALTGSPYTHVATAAMTIMRAAIPGAGIFGGNITVPKDVTFSNGGVSGAVAIQANGSITAASGSSIAGNTASAPLATLAYIAPTAATVNFYGVGSSSGKYVCCDGVTLGTPQLITASSISSSNIPTASSGNPGAVYYHTGNLTISGALTLNGTLIVRGGNLTISNATTITPRTGYPALVCEQSVTLKSALTLVTANGVVFIGGNYKWGSGATNSQFAINGALLMPSGSTIGVPNNSALVVTYSSSKANVPYLTTFDQPGLSVKLSNWSQ